MNFKLTLFYFFALQIVSSCGVKGPPSAPPNTAIPSYIDSFKKSPPDSKAKAKTKKSDPR